MKALLLTQGSHGDIHPFIAIGRALQTLGHEVRLVTNPYFAAQTAEAGLPFMPMGERIDLKHAIAAHAVMDARRGAANVLLKFVLPNVPEIVRRTRELLRAERPDVVVYHPIVVGAPWACTLEGGVPTVSITPTPTLWASRGDRVVLLPGSASTPSALAAWFGRAVSQWFLRFAFDRPLNALRAELGLAPARDQLWAHARNADLNLGLWSALFRGPRPQDPVHSEIVGFPWYDQDPTQQVPSRELDEFFDAGAAPLVFALGSTGVHAAGRFFEHAVAATRTLGSRALLVVGRDQPPPANLPGDGSIKAVPYAPFSATFRRASVIVHHGGVGTTAQSLAAARPVLVTPMAHDQFDNAARVSRLGVGEGLPFADVDARRLTVLLERLAREPRYAVAAAALGPRISAEDGAARAAELIAERFAIFGTRQALPVT